MFFRVFFFLLCSCHGLVPCVDLTMMKQKNAKTASKVGKWKDTVVCSLSLKRHRKNNWNVYTGKWDMSWTCNTFYLFHRLLQNDDSCLIQRIGTHNDNWICCQAEKECAIIFAKIAAIIQLRVLDLISIVPALEAYSEVSGGLRSGRTKQMFSLRER